MRRIDVYTKGISLLENDQFSYNIIKEPNEEEILKRLSDLLTLSKKLKCILTILKDGSTYAGIDTSIFMDVYPTNPYINVDVLNASIKVVIPDCVREYYFQTHNMTDKNIPLIEKQNAFNSDKVGAIKCYIDHAQKMFSNQKDIYSKMTEEIMPDVIGILIKM